MLRWSRSSRSGGGGSRGDSLGEFGFRSGAHRRPRRGIGRFEAVDQERIGIVAEGERERVAHLGSDGIRCRDGDRVGGAGEVEGRR